MGGRERFEGRKVGIKDEEGSRSSRRSSRSQNGDRMRNSGRKRGVGGKERSGKGEAVSSNLVKGRENVVAKSDRHETRRRETWNRRWEESNLAQTHANPTSRMDGIVVQSGRSCRSHLKAPRSKAESEGEVREGNAAVEISRKSEEEKEAGELELRREEVDQGEDRAKPSELSSGIEVGATTAGASYARITIDEPVQSWV
jgi:hypothetical protein